jgi:hypothetical protein
MSTSDTGPCANCGRVFDGHHCPDCGQTRFDPNHTLKQLLVDLADSLDLESRLIDTVRDLFLRPGRLTAEFLAGRRVRYFSPFKLYFLASMAFFAALFSVGDTPASRRQTSIERAPAALQPPRPAGSSPPTLAHQDGPAWLVGPLERLQAWLEAKDRAMREDPQLRSNSYQNNAPRLLVAFLPVFALLTFAFFRRRQRYFVPHIYFAAHVNSAMFVVFAVVVLLKAAHVPLVKVEHALIFVAIPYLIIALHRVFGESWLRSALKGLAITGIYTACLSATARLLDFITLLMA